MAAKTIKVVIAVTIDSGVDAHDAIAECEYSLTGDGIGSTEIVEVLDENDSKVF